MIVFQSSPATWDHLASSPLNEKTIDDCGAETFNCDIHSQDDLASLPSPNTSEMIISDVLIASVSIFSFAD